MKNLFTAVIFPFIAGMYTSQANSANSYAYLWGAYFSASGNWGNLHYTGSVLSSINGKIEALNTRTMVINYNECNASSPEGVFYTSSDKWIFLASTVNINGKEVSIFPHSFPKGFTPTKYKYRGYYIIKQNDGISSNHYYPWWGECLKVNTTYPINYTYPKFEIMFDVSNLGTGNYRGDIPIKLGYAEYYGKLATDIIKFPDELAFDNTTSDYIPYSISITNKCTTKENISLSHGRLPIDKAEGNIATDMLNISCDFPATLKLSVQSRSLPTQNTSYSNGIGVGLGNGWASEVKIGDSGLSDVSLTKTISVPQGGISMPITSTLRENGNISSGNISGNLVLSISMD